MDMRGLGSLLGVLLGRTGIPKTGQFPSLLVERERRKQIVVGVS
jgi:hypothetical protein